MRSFRAALLAQLTPQESFLLAKRSAINQVAEGIFTDCSPLSGPIHVHPTGRPPPKPQVLLRSSLELLEGFRGVEPTLAARGPHRALSEAVTYKRHKLM